MNHKPQKVFVMLIFVFSIILFPMAAKASPINLKYSIFLPKIHPQTKVAMNWAKEVEKQTGGKVKIAIFPGSSLIGPADCYDGVISGIADIGFSRFSFTPGRFRVMAAVDLPMGYPNGKVASRVANNFFNYFNPEELKDVKVLYLHAPGPDFLHSNKKVKHIMDFKGMRVAAYGWDAEVAKTLGGIPKAIPLKYVYKDLQKGLVEGSLSPAYFLKMHKLTEVSKFTTDISVVGYTNAVFVIMNKNKWDSLPDDIKAIIENINKRWVDKHGNEWDKLDKESLKYASELGHKLIKISEEEIEKWRDAVRPIIKNYIKTTINGATYISTIEKLMNQACAECNCPEGTHLCDHGCCVNENR